MNVFSNDIAVVHATAFPVRPSILMYAALIRNPQTTGKTWYGILISLQSV